MKRFALRPSEWPITAKVPMLVVVLMLAVSAVITQQVLVAARRVQRQHFDELAASYLDGLSSSLVPAVLREDVWETFDILIAPEAYIRAQDKLKRWLRMAAGPFLRRPTGRPSLLLACQFRHQQRFLAGQPVWLDEKREIAGAQRQLPIRAARLVPSTRNLMWRRCSANGVRYFGPSL